MTDRPPIVHPGPVSPQRHALSHGATVPLDFTIDPGETVEAGLARGMEAAGCDGGYVEIRGGRFDPFRYVIPAEAPDTGHAAWYSDTFAPDGGADVERAGLMVGRRDGVVFAHCHGLWRSDEGIAMGHMLPGESIAAEPVRVLGVGLRGATFESRHDAETNFRLFAAEPVVRTRTGDAPALAVTLKPNQDLSHALEAICADNGIRKATIYGIGSLNGARFETGPDMDSFASEFLITEGRLEKAPEGAGIRLDIIVVAIDGSIFEGRLVNGENPVCVTCEMVIVPEA